MCSTPSGTELRGDPAICPGNNGIFECRTTNTGLLSWSVDNINPLSFRGDNEVSDGIAESGNVASLVELNFINGVGNWTSLLLVPPANNVTRTIICSGGNPLSTCNRDINFLGKSTAMQLSGLLFYMLRAHLMCCFYSIGTGGIEKPVYGNHTTSEDGEFITHSWGHITEAIVSHYILTLTLTTFKDNGQIFEYNVTSTSITIPSTSIDLNGTLSAVSMCGDMSEPVSFQGTII